MNRDDLRMNIFEILASFDPHSCALLFRLLRPFLKQTTSNMWKLAQGELLNAFYCIS